MVEEGSLLNRPSLYLVPRVVYRRVVFQFRVLGRAPDLQKLVGDAGLC